MQNYKLLPCPFCGGNLKRIKGGYEHKPNKCIASSIIFGDAFVERWNTRKPMERIVDRLEEMFKHHSATKTVQRLVLETVKDWWCR